jgi:uncharacterized protein YraI
MHLDTRKHALRMTNVALALLVLIAAACGASPAPAKATITKPAANAPFQVGQVVEIEGTVTGSGLKTIDVFVDAVSFASVGGAGISGELSISTRWTPDKAGSHTIEVKGRNDKGEVVVASDALIVTVIAPTPTPAPVPTQAPQPTAAPAATAAPTQMPQPTAAPVSQDPMAGVKEGDYVNVREGPALTYNRVGQLNAGQAAPVIGRNADSTWWQIRFPGADAGVGWVLGTLIEVTGNTSGLGVAEAPPMPTEVVAAVQPTQPPAATAAPQPQPTAASSLPDYAQQPYSQQMLFAPRDSFGDIPLGVNAEPRVMIVSWRVYGATKLEMEISNPKAPDLYNAQCVPGNLDNIQADSSYVAHQRFPIKVPEGFIQFTIPSTGYYVITIYVTKADGTTTTIPRPLLVENCYKRQ